MRVSYNGVCVATESFHLRLDGFESPLASPYIDGRG